MFFINQDKTFKSKLIFSVLSWQNVLSYPNNEAVFLYIAKFSYSRLKIHVNGKMSHTLSYFLSFSQDAVKSFLLNLPHNISFPFHRHKELNYSLLSLLIYFKFFIELFF